MRVVVHILNGCIDCMTADEPCEVLVINRDELAEEVLADGERGYASVWDVPANPEAVAEDFKFAGFVHS